MLKFNCVCHYTVELVDHASLVPDPTRNDLPYRKLVATRYMVSRLL